MEHKFEEIVGQSFSESVGYASECIQAIRIVTSLNMEGRIEKQFSSLLQSQCVKAKKHAMKAMVWFALSESIELLCMCLTFWSVYLIQGEQIINGNLGTVDSF